jgi:hypothetical protein
MTDTLLMVLVLGVLVIALGTIATAAVGWIRRKIER